MVKTRHAEETAHFYYSLDSGEIIYFTLNFHLNGRETEVHCEKHMLHRGEDLFLESCFTNIDWCRILTI